MAPAQRRESSLKLDESTHVLRYYTHHCHPSDTTSFAAIVPRMMLIGLFLLARLTFEDTLNSVKTLPRLTRRLNVASLIFTTVGYLHKKKPLFIANGW